MISINVDPSDTIKHVKTGIVKSNKTSLNEQALRFDHQELNGNETVSYYNITNQSLLC